MKAGPHRRAVSAPDPRWKGNRIAAYAGSVAKQFVSFFRKMADRLGGTRPPRRVGRVVAQAHYCQQRATEVAFHLAHFGPLALKRGLFSGEVRAKPVPAPCCDENAS